MNRRSDNFGDGMHVAWAKLGEWVSGFYALIPNLIVGSMVLVVFVAVGYVLGKTTYLSFRRRAREDLGDMLSDSVFWGLALIGLLIALTIVLPSLKPGDLVAGLGVSSVAIGFAFKDILQNWLAGLLILLRQPFRRGDQITVGAIEGTVQKINQRATLIKTYDSRVVVVPNADIYTQSIAVHTAYENRRISLDVTVGYENDVRTIQKIITRALAPIEEIKPEPAPQVLPWDLGATSLGLKVRFWIDSRRSSEVAARARAVQAIKEAFQANDVDPTDPQIVYAHQVRAEEAGAASAQSREIGLQPAAPCPVASRGDDPESERPKEGKAGTLL